MMMNGRWLLVIWLAMMGWGSASIYHVSLVGDDLADGSEAHPWRTLQRAVDVALAGDRVIVTPGVYPQRLRVSGKKATADQPIRIEATGAVLSMSGFVPGSGEQAVVEVVDSDYVWLEGLEISEWKTESKLSTPIGIWVHGSGVGVELRRCKVHDVWQSFPTKRVMTANGFGVLVQGEQTLPIQGFRMEGCEVYRLRTGASESVSLNGNVQGFEVVNNLVHDNNNIGIDIIGHEGTAPSPELDQARDGKCIGNHVWAIDSKFNPAYGGNFTTGGGNATLSAPGIYVDGGSGVRIERNHVHGCNFAISLGSEWAGKETSRVWVRNNHFHHCHVGGLVMGGSDALTNGGVSDSEIAYNTFYQNDTVGYGGGQISIQNHVRACLIQHNAMICQPSTGQMILNTNTTCEFAAGAIDWNAYSGAANGALEWIWKNTSQATLGQWQTASGQDAHSLWVASVGMRGPDWTEASPASHFQLLLASPLRDRGNPGDLQALADVDFDGKSRVYGGCVDIGADEWQPGWNRWCAEQFGSSEVEALADADGDAWNNVMEYAFASNPKVATDQPLVGLSVNNGRVRYFYQKPRSDVDYQVEMLDLRLGKWISAPWGESGDGGGHYWCEWPQSQSGMVRMKLQRLPKD